MLLSVAQGFFSKSFPQRRCYTNTEWLAVALLEVTGTSLPNLEAYSTTA